MKKRLYLLMVLLVPVLMFAQQDMQVPMASDTTATVTDTTAAVNAMQQAAFDTTVFGQETDIVDVNEEDYMVQEEGAKSLGITAGVNVGYPVWKSSGLANNDVSPQFGLIVSTPYGLSLGALDFGVGAEVGYYSFPYPASTAMEAKGLVLMGTLNTLLADTPYGPVSARAGGGYFGKSLGFTAGLAYDYTTPAIPLLFRVYVRANGTLDSGSAVGSTSWIAVGAMISYDLSAMF